MRRAPRGLVGNEFALINPDGNPVTKGLPMNYPVKIRATWRVKGKTFALVEARRMLLEPIDVCAELKVIY